MGMEGQEKYLFAYDEDKFIVKIPLEEIYFIETIKSSHYCTIVYREGEAKMRADIIHLEKKLDDRFLKVRSSTLVNIGYIEKIDRKNRIIYFPKGQYCTYSSKNYSLIKEKLQIIGSRRS